jgi:hypothetical protein
MTAQPLAGTTDPHDPVWSPDGQSIAFFADGKAETIAASGGSVQTSATRPTVAARAGATAASSCLRRTSWARCRRVPATGGKPTPVTSLDAGRQEDSHRQPFFLPDGRHFLFIARSNKRENTAWRSARSTTPSASTCSNTESKAVYSPPGYVLFLTDGDRGRPDGIAVRCQAIARDRARRFRLTRRCRSTFPRSAPRAPASSHSPASRRTG